MSTMPDIVTFKDLGLYQQGSAVEHALQGVKAKGMRTLHTSEMRSGHLRAFTLRSRDGELIDRLSSSEVKHDVLHAFILSLEKLAQRYDLLFYKRELTLELPWTETRTKRFTLAAKHSSGAKAGPTPRIVLTLTPT